MVVSTDRRALELVVVGVLHGETGIEPRPARRTAGAEWDVGKLRDPAVAVRAEAAGKSVPLSANAMWFAV